MAGLPQNFSAISNVLPTYDFVDIIAGTGYVNFYLGKTVDLTLLSNFTYYSNIYVQTITLSGVDSKLLDLDFDVVVNRPLDVKGLAILNFPVYRAAIGAGYSTHIYIIAKLRKWDGVTETEIISNTSTDVTGTSTAEYKMLATDLDVPLTHYKKGETLRLTVEVWGGSSNGSAAGAVAHDPMNRSTLWDTSGACPSKAILQLPVRLNL